MYPYQGRSQGQGQQQQQQQQQPQAPPSSSSTYGRRPSASHSPEQSRASIGRSVPPHSPGGMSSHSHHGSAADEERWHHRPPPPDMRDMHYPPPPPPHQSRYGGGGGREREEYGNRPPPPHGHHPPPPPWMEDRGYPGTGNAAGRHSSGGYPHPHGPPPPQQRMMDDRMAGPPPGRAPSSYTGQPTGPSYSHPPSPSRRPRTPPPMARNSNQASSGGRAAPWDAGANSGPMSAPPNLVPRMPTGTSSSGSGAAGGPQRPGSHITSPSLPSLSREPGSGHQRAPSWGPYTSTSKENAAALGGEPGAGYRGASVDAYGRSSDPSSRPLESRKRPASDSPPTHTSGPLPVQQLSPSQQRGDVMSMSSILGPSGGRAPSGPPPDMSLVNNNNNNGSGGSAEKRRRLDSAGQNGAGGSPSKTESNAGNAARFNNQQLSISEAAAANLARRKWSGPIAEEAAQQAAAWRAQEQRWGTGATRSPKVGSLALGNGAGERNTSPFGAPANSFGTRGASPSVQEGHRRQRSDGLTAPGHNAPIDARSPLARTAPLRGPSPPLPSRATKQQQQQQQQQGPPPPHAFGGGAPPGYYRGPSPPPPHPQEQALMHGGPHFGGQQGHPPPPHAYGQPGYHAYDSQGRPVEIDLDEVRGGAFAGHGSPAPPPRGHLNDAGFHHGMAPPSMPPPLTQSQYDDQQQRGRMPPPPHQQQQASQPGRRDGPPQQGGGAKVAQSGQPNVLPPSHAFNGKSGGAPMQQQQQQQQQGRGQPPQQQALRERDSKANIRRSVTPIMPGPAKGLLPARVDLAEAETGRPRYPSKDFNSGPKVDSDAVWAALREVDEQARERNDGDAAALAADDAPTTLPPIGRHLGSFLYDARKSVLLSGELLRRNVGATLEIRVPGQLLGVGPMDLHEDDDAAAAKKQGESQSGVWHGRWALGPKSAGIEAAADPVAAKEDDTSSAEEQEADAQAFWKFDAALQRKAWGTDVYTDDSDVVMMCLHSGWLQGPHTDDVPGWVPPGKATLAWRRMTDDLASRGIGFDDGTTAGEAPQPTNVSSEWMTRRAERLRRTADLSVMLRVAPKLIAYKGSQRGGVKTRSWGNTHDGVSLMVEHVALRRAGYASGERGLRSMKQRIDQLARLRMLANIAGDEKPAAAAAETADKVVAKTTAAAEAARQRMLAGGLLDILAAARLVDKDGGGGDTEKAGEQIKHFWQFDPLVHVKAA